MGRKKFNLEKNGRQVLENVCIADRFFSRFRGLMLKKSLPYGGLYIKPCSQIHTFMMRFPIDAIFISREKEVLYIEDSIKPSRVSRYVRKAEGVIETSAGFAKNNGIMPGDKLDFIIIK